jgi:hypothetical protein
MLKVAIAQLLLVASGVVGILSAYVALLGLTGELTNALALKFLSIAILVWGRQEHGFGGPKIMTFHRDSVCVTS